MLTTSLLKRCRFGFPSPDYSATAPIDRRDRALVDPLPRGRAWILLIRRSRWSDGASRKSAALEARCSFKMVISRPREHYARGQFNSGRMIAPSRWCCPFIFLCLPLSIQFGMSSDSARSNSLRSRGATLRLPSALPSRRVTPLAVRSILFPLSIFFSRPNGTFSPLELFP